MNNNIDRDKQLSELIDFAINKTTKTQRKKILKCDDIEVLIMFLISAYNCYIFMHNKVMNQMITNPNDLFFSTKEQQDFIEIIKNHIIDELYHNTYNNTIKED